jgi:hypothetical protein
VSEVDRLLAWFADGSLVRPDASQPGTVHLAQSLLGLASGDRAELDAPVQTISDAIGVAEHYVLVLVDGLGMNLVEALPAGSFLRRHNAMELTSVFPSSTAPALTALFTGCWPAEHAVTGWWTYLPDAGLTSTILPFVERFSERPLGEFGVASGSVFTTPTAMSGIPGASSWMPNAIADSTSSQYFRGGTPAHGYERLDDACAGVARALAAAEHRSYTYLYVPYIDNAAHEHGPGSAAVRKARANVERDVEQLARALRGRARLVLTADHGQIDVDREDQTIIGENDALLRLLLVPPTGDYRAPLFHVRPGQQERFTAEFRERLGAAWALITTDEIDELRLLGPAPMAPETRRRWGDFVAIGPGRDAVRYAPPAEPMLGYHGGLRPEEVRVPLIVV